MKKKADILAKINATITGLLGKQKFDDMPPPAAPDAIVLTTLDGVAVNIDKLESGGKAVINGMPAPANTYTFTDGSSIIVDATGTITTVTPAAPATQPAASAAAPVATPPVAQPAPVTAPAPTQMSAQEPATQQPAATAFKFATDAPKDIDALFAAFATGTPEERIANLETVIKPIIEYCFGWEIRQAKEKAERDAAIKIYTESIAPLQTQMSAQEKTITEQANLIVQLTTLIKEFIEEPVSNPPAASSKVAFANLGKPKKSIEKFAAAAAKIAEEKATAKA